MQKILGSKSEKICRDILKQIHNEDVNIQIDPDGKSSLYVFLNNTIYVSERNGKTKKTEEEQNKSKLLVIAHECAHSVQPKILQFTNFILSNIEILLFALILFLRFILKYENTIALYTYIVVLMTSIFVRLYLELDAIVESVKISERYMLNNNINKEQVMNLVKFYKKQTLKSLPMFIFSLFAFKIIRLVIALVI